MHEVLVAGAFIMMLAVPAMVSMGGNQSDDTLSQIFERAGAGEVSAEPIEPTV